MGWQDAPEVTEGWQSAPVIEDDEPQETVTTEEVQKPTFISKAKETFGRLKNLSVGEAAIGVGETALQGVTGAAGSIMGGLSGLNTMAMNARYGVEANPADSVQKAQEAMTYEPRTEGGKAVSDALSLPFEEYEKMAYNIASDAGTPEQTLGATGAYTALMMLPAAIGMRRKSVKSKGGEAPTTETLRQEATRLYKQADESGASVKADSFKGAMDAIQKRLADEGFDKDLHPKTYAALRNLTEKMENNQTLKGVEINRRLINEARSTMDKSDARMAGRVMDVYDNWMNSLSQKDMLTGSADAAALYPQARSLWQRKMKSDEIEWAIERAQNRVKANYSHAAFDTALRQEFKAILNNKNRRRMFSKKELEAISKVVEGDFTANTLRNLGRFAVRGPVSAIPTMAATAFNPAIGAGVAVLAEGAKRAGSKRTARLANEAAETMRRGEQ